MQWRVWEMFPPGRFHKSVQALLSAYVGFLMFFPPNATVHISLESTCTGCKNGRLQNSNLWKRNTYICAFKENLLKGFRYFTSAVSCFKTTQDVFIHNKRHQTETHIFTIRMLYFLPYRSLQFYNNITKAFKLP